MFAIERKSLGEMVAQDNERYEPIKEKVQTISNLSTTMDTFIANLITEINDSRTQMFDILENIALEEQQAALESKRKNKK